MLSLLLGCPNFMWTKKGPAHATNRRNRAPCPRGRCASRRLANLDAPARVGGFAARPARSCQSRKYGGDTCQGIRADIGSPAAAGDVSESGGGHDSLPCVLPSL